MCRGYGLSIFGVTQVPFFVQCQAGTRFFPLRIQETSPGVHNITHYHVVLHCHVNLQPLFYSLRSKIKRGVPSGYKDGVGKCVAEDQSVQSFKQV